MAKINLGLLDFGLRDERMNSMRIVEDLVEYARHADQLGFSRFWIAEHHSTGRRMAWSNPQPLVPILAGMTDRIRIGVAGVLLGIHNTYHVASHFKLLANLFPKRIDLGLANGVVSEKVAQMAVQRSNKESRALFEQNSRQLVHILRNEEELYENGKGIVIPPYKGEIPEIWSLGVSYDSLNRALELESNFARSIFHHGSDNSYEQERLARFKEEFYAIHKRKPRITLALAGCCHSSNLKAKRILMSLNQDTQVAKGEVFGTPDKFYDQIMEVTEKYGIDEVIFMSAALNVKDRMLGIELISDVFRLNSN
ncbi:LLM class flavin-dependent oxidoreductase [Cytophagaceae bacterium YF14B1]|uniref:LLM class flavin-dependent oxidoreductase n=1 Tax=Xanthocytophaga flava TaxID=3048013 RepID=A0AAE3U9Y3_9BACT|nr:LLM class flavin-dependent oxidoreductase [Xanthocytophaga flavus]MDJ1485594.1 LLM class flavin-dependent oxidoreductase [Xanthocytophaga flavus]